MLWDTKPTHFRNSGVPEGYCGLCEVCERPGHSRHFPGASPATGTWCDKHYNRLRFLHPNGAIGCFLYLALIIGVIFAVFQIN